MSYYLAGIRFGMQGRMTCRVTSPGRIVCGSDDFQLRVYNYNTSEKITSFEAHPDYIRAIVVHPTQPFVLTPQPLQLRFRLHRRIWILPWAAFRFRTEAFLALSPVLHRPHGYQMWRG